LQSAMLFSAIENRFGIQLGTEAFRAHTVQSLSRYVEGCQRQNSATVFASRNTSDSIFRKLRGYFSAWRGERHRPDSLICRRNGTGCNPPVFWCFQGNQEHEQLASALGKETPIYGMRSGYLIFRYTPENVTVLARHYADEMVEIQPLGPFVVAGNCQGGIIAQQIAEELRSRGREISLLCLLNPSDFPAYSGQVVLIIPSESDRSPYRVMQSPDDLFRERYGDRYTVSFISGTHDNSFENPQVEMVSSILNRHLLTVHEYPTS